MAAHSTNTTRPSSKGHAGAPSAIILAAGMGKRMQSDLPKVLHPVGEPPRPMVQAVVDACRGAGCRKIVLVVGHKHELVRAAFAGQHDVEFALQSPQLGTGHAVQCAQALFEGIGDHDPVIVLAGDGPLIRAETLALLLDRHRATGASATLATSRIADPTGYGRIVRDAQGRFAGIVEHKDCTPAQCEIREINPSYYCFGAGALFSNLSKVKVNPGSGEYYLTDVPALLLSQGERVEVIDAVPPEDVLSINTPEQLAEVDRIFRSRAGAGLAGHAKEASR